MIREAVTQVTNGGKIQLISCGNSWRQETLQKLPVAVVSAQCVNATSCR